MRQHGFENFGVLPKKSFGNLAAPIESVLA